MSKVQIICSRPGMLRNGIPHPPSAFYPGDHWTPAQIDAFRADPAFTVREVDDEAENVLTEDDFQLAVTAEVNRQLAELQANLQAGFNQSVADAVTEKLAAGQTDFTNQIDSLGKQLIAANEKAALLQAQLAAVPAAPAAGKTK